MAERGKYDEATPQVPDRSGFAKLILIPLGILGTIATVVTIVGIKSDKKQIAKLQKEKRGGWVDT